jgi:hypothetical protein
MPGMKSNRVQVCRCWLSASAAALREFTLNGTEHASHHEQGSIIRCYIAWRNRNTGNPRFSADFRARQLSPWPTEGRPRRTSALASLCRRFVPSLAADG